MESRKYQLENNEMGTDELYFTDDEMRSLVHQFKRHIELETGKTDDAIGTNTESVDDAHDDMGNPGIKFSKS